MHGEDFESPVAQGKSPKRLMLATNSKAVEGMFSVSRFSPFPCLLVNPSPSAELSDSLLSRKAMKYRKTDLPDMAESDLSKSYTSFSLPSKEETGKRELRLSAIGSLQFGQSCSSTGISSSTTW